jgi:hypothetical protein
MHTRIHKIHHNPNLGEANTFPFIIFFVINHEAASEGHFVLGLLSLDSSIWNPKPLNIGTLGILEGHNFLCRPLIKVRFKAKL